MKMLISKPTCQIFIDSNFDDYTKKVVNLELRNHIISNLDILVVWRFKALDPLRNGMV
jgi:hypothetical protein